MFWPLAIMLTACITQAAHGQQFDQTFNKATKFMLSLPFPGEIQLSSNDSNRVLIDAPQDKLDRINVIQYDDYLVLNITEQQDVSTTDGTYKIWASNASIEQLTLAGAGTLNVTPEAFASQPGITLLGSPIMTIMNTSSDFQVEQDGHTILTIAGTPGNINLKASGDSLTYLLGVTGTVKAALAGAGKVYVNGTDNLTITGSVAGISEVHYASGDCTVSSPIPNRNPCIETTDIEISEAALSRARSKTG